MKQKGYNPERSAYGGESKGFAPILIVLLVAVLGIGGYFGYINYSQNRTTVTPAPSISNDSSLIPDNTDETANPDSIGANWKTYTNTKYGFLFKYPRSWWEGKAEKDSYFFGPPATINHIGEKIPPAATAELVIILVDISKNNYDLDKSIESYNSCVSNENSLKEVTNIGGNHAVVFKNESLCGLGNGRDIAYVIHNGYLYEITKNYWGSDVEIDQILYTFKFTQ